MSIPATLSFAVASTFTDLSSAVPYFAAVSRIAAELQTLPAQLLALGWYNLLYCSPMIALIVMRAALSETASAALFGRMRMSIDWGFAKLLPSAMAIAAAALVIDGMRRLIF